MSTHTVPRLSPAFRRALERVSAFDVAWDARWHRLNAMTGQTGTGTFATGNSLIGTDGSSLAALTGQPRWQHQDIDAAVPGRDMATLLFGSGDTLSFDVAGYRTGAVTLLLELVQPASFPAAGGLLYLGNDAVSAGRLMIRSTGSGYEAAYHDGSTEVVSSIGITPSAGQHVWLRATRDATGRVRMHQCIGLDVAAETSASQSGSLTPVAYGEPCRFRLNGIGTANQTTFAARRALLALGLWTLAAMVNRF